MKVVFALMALLVWAPVAKAESIIGIGVVLSQDAGNGVILVEEVLPGGPADHSQVIQAGDFVDAVKTLPESDWTDTKGLGLDAVVNLIRGEEGTEVSLNLVPAGGGAPFQVTLKRERIQIPE